jgi:hypothetical protein
MDSIQSTTNILEPKDRYIVSVNDVTVSSTGLTSRSEHLFNSEQLLKRYMPFNFYAPLPS